MKEGGFQNEYDVIVVGAGVGGCCAAIAAAEMGRRTLLIEQEAGPGGVAVHCGCPVFLGFGYGSRQLVGGLGERLLRALDSMGAVAEVDAHGRIAERLSEGALTGIYTTTEPQLALCLNRMLGKAGVERLYYATVTGAQTEGEKVRSIDLFCAGRSLRIYGCFFVDASGDAILSGLAGAPVIEGSPEDTMTKTILFKVNGVRAFDKVLLRKKFVHACAEKRFPFAGQDLFMGNPLGNTDEILLNLSLVSGNALDPLELTRMDIELREQVFPILEWLRAEFEEFRNARLVAIAPKIGVRAGRCLDARAVITCRDLIEDTPVPDPVAVAKRGFGGHGIHSFRSPWEQRLAGCRGIPYRALQARKIENLLAAGRSIGVEPRAISAVRMMSTCMATGHAAGVGAALSASRREFAPYGMVREELLRQHAILEFPHESGKETQGSNMPDRENRDMLGEDSP